jgi:hypothetical protein
VVSENIFISLIKATKLDFCHHPHIFFPEVCTRCLEFGQSPGSLEEKTERISEVVL